MIIGNTDVTETEKIKKRYSRNTKRTLREEKLKTQNISSSQFSKEECNKEVPLKTRRFTEFDESKTDKPSCSSTKRNYLEIPTVAAICDKYKISHRSAAAVASAVLQDVGIVTKSDKEIVIDKIKMRRAREHNRKTLSNNF